MIYRLTLTTIAIALVACGGGTGGPAGSDTGEPPSGLASPSADGSDARVEGFEVEVRTDRGTYQPDEVVMFTVRACNRGPATTTESGGGSNLLYSFWVLDPEDEVVADDSHAIRTLELRIVSWQPGQCREVKGTWDQHYWNRPADEPSEPPDIRGTPIRGNRVPPGAYRIRIVSSPGGAISDPFTIEG